MLMVMLVLGLVVLTNKICLDEAYSNNRWGYDVMYTVARLSRASGAQGGEGLGSQ